MKIFIILGLLSLVLCAGCTVPLTVEVKNSPQAMTEAQLAMCIQVVDQLQQELFTKDQQCPQL